MSTPRTHEKWCKSMPREFDAAMGRGPYECDCGAAGVAAPLEPSPENIEAAQHQFCRKWMNEHLKPRDNIVLEDFVEYGIAYAAAVSKNLQEENAWMSLQVEALKDVNKSLKARIAELVSRLTDR